MMPLTFKCKSCFFIYFQTNNRPNETENENINTKQTNYFNLCIFLFLMVLPHCFLRATHTAHIQCVCITELDFQKWYLDFSNFNVAGSAFLCFSENLLCFYMKKAIYWACTKCFFRIFVSSFFVYNIYHCNCIINIKMNSYCVYFLCPRVVS